MASTGEEPPTSGPAFATDKRRTAAADTEIVRILFDTRRPVSGEGSCRPARDLTKTLIATLPTPDAGAREARHGLAAIVVTGR